MTTLYDFEGRLGMASRRLLLALTISWSQLLAHGPQCSRNPKHEVLKISREREREMNLTSHEW